MDAWQLLIAGALWISGIGLILIASRRMEGHRRRRARLIKVIHNPRIRLAEGEASSLARDALTLLKPTDDFRAMAEFVHRRKLKGTGAILFLERHFDIEPLGGADARLGAYLARLYRADGRQAEARRILDWLILEGRAEAEDRQLRATIALENAEVSPFVLHVCELVWKTCADGVFRTRLEDHLVANALLRLGEPRTADPTLCDFAARSRAILEGRRTQNPQDRPLSLALVRCYDLLNEPQACHEECLRAKRLFGEDVLPDVSSRWGPALQSLCPPRGFEREHLAETAGRLHLATEDLMAVLEYAYRDSGDPALLGPLAETCAYELRPDPDALGYYRTAVEKGLASLQIMEALLRNATETQDWALAIEVGMRLCREDPDRPEWPETVTRCFLQREPRPLSAGELEIARAAAPAFHRDPDYHRLLLQSLLGKESWFDADVRLARKLLDGPLNKTGAQELRQRILREEARDFARIQPIWSEWWENGGRDLETVHRLVDRYVSDDITHSLVVECAGWLVARGVASLVVCTYLLEVLKSRNEKPGDEIPRQLDDLWRKVTEFEQPDLEAFLALLDSGVSPSAHASRLGLEQLLDAGEAGTSARVVTEMLRKGHFDYGLVRRCLEEIPEEGRRDFEDAARRALIDHDRDVFPTALGLLEKQAAAGGPEGFDPRLLDALLRDYFAKSVSNEARREAWSFLEDRILGKETDELSESEQKTLYFALETGLSDLSESAVTEAARGLCGLLLERTPPRGLDLAKSLADRGHLTPDLALQSLEVCAK